MSNLNWSKDGLRRQVDALLAGYMGPVAKIPAGVTGNVSSEKRSEYSISYLLKKISVNLTGFQKVMQYR